MNFIISLISCFAILFMVIEKSNAQSGVFQTPRECENQDKAVQEQCVNEFCATNQNVFVCKALECKNSIGEGILQQFAKLKCIQNLCTSNPSEIVCQKLQECEEKKKTEGLFPFIECVITLFAEQ